MSKPRRCRRYPCGSEATHTTSLGPEHPGVWVAMLPRGGGPGLWCREHAELDAAETNAADGGSAQLRLAVGG